jgi:FAD/FMN-containing dehydrogenase/Fe-S oxidoreductase
MKNLITKFNQQLLYAGYAGNFITNLSSRIVNATDNSIYEILPLAIAEPLNSDDVKLLLEVANKELFKQLNFTAKGGGTGTNGQALTNCIVIDFSRFMNKIIEFNHKEGWIIVEPGITLIQLNSFLQQFNLFFAPNVSTADRATIGGMIATDAAGKGSLIYGKTSDHVLQLNLVLADGSTFSTDKINIETIVPTNKVGKLYKDIINLITPVQDEINKRFIPLKRALSGYNIKECYSQNHFNLCKLIAGSEGTLALVTGAKLNLTPIPKYKALVVVHYNNFIDALIEAEELIKFEPAAIEAVDEKVQNSAQSLPQWPQISEILKIKDQAYISNFIEFVANDKQQLTDKITQLEVYLKNKQMQYVVVNDKNQINLLWSIRSLAVGLVGKIPGARKPVAFIEDSIVPPANLANFVKDLKQILDDKQLQFAIYGHVDAGCIHVRPALDMQNNNDRLQIRQITTAVNNLLQQYHGVLWGEHGKGFRGEFVPEVFGPILYPILCKIKALFDPNNQFNPGKIAIPDITKYELFKIDQVPMRGQFDEKINSELQQQFLGAMWCNGNAACFNQDQKNIMCPSYKATDNRVHSPKGRAMLVKEWLRKLSSSNSIRLKEDKFVAAQTLSALDGCLGCKACASKCPVQVSIPDLKTKFLNHYHQKYKSRNMNQIINTYIEHLVQYLAKVRIVSNSIFKLKFMPKFGFNSFLSIANPYMLNRLIKNKRVNIYKLNMKLEKNDVVIFVDSFSQFIENKQLINLINVLERLEYKIYLTPPIITGKALIVNGAMDKFKKNAAKVTQLLNSIFSQQIEVVALENTFTLMFKDEYVKYSDVKLEGQVLSIAQFLYKNINNLNKLNITLESNYNLLPHCTEQAMALKELSYWNNIFQCFSSEVKIHTIGCCGMAGSYGYQKRNQETSQKLFADNWAHHINGSENIIATGFSCRSQAKRMINKEIPHPIDVIAQRL